VRMVTGGVGEIGGLGPADAVVTGIGDLVESPVASGPDQDWTGCSGDLHQGGISIRGGILGGTNHSVHLGAAQLDLRELQGSSTGRVAVRNLDHIHGVECSIGVNDLDGGPGLRDEEKGSRRNQNPLSV